MTAKAGSGFKELQEEVLELKRALNAIIVAHNYQRPEVQDIADFTGDSLELARKCVGIKAKVIVFCGVLFMAETAAILNPGTTVLLSHRDAGCPLADTIDVDSLREWKGRYPEAAVVAYVNTTAAIKAESDICCTSANGVEVVNAIPDEEILFIPDRNLGHYVSTRTDKKLILYPGFCATHDNLSVEEVKAARQRYPQAKVLVHPECRPEVIELADAALSTSQMLRYAKGSNAKIFLIGTEEGMLYPLRKQNPDKEFHLISNSLVCPDMKKTTLERVIETMKARKNIVTVPEEIRVRAKKAIDRMLAIG
ncbi:MAG: quinolinate synthase [Dehalococcoidia bacterium CG2_30_46_19]|nr:MAG: quinolinate synthase [Dehalococcoidia bacterium CG2_30_46_19]